MYSCLLNDTYKISNIINLSEVIDDSYYKIMITSVVKPEEHSDYLKNIYNTFITPDIRIETIKVFDSDDQTQEPFITYNSYNRIIKATIFTEYDDSRRFKCIITFLGQSINSSEE